MSDDPSYHHGDRKAAAARMEQLRADHPDIPLDHRVRVVRTLVYDGTWEAVSQELGDSLPEGTTHFHGGTRAVSVGVSTGIVVNMGAGPSEAAEEAAERAACAHTAPTSTPNPTTRGSL